MRRSKRPPEWVEEGCGSQREDEAQSPKRPRRSGSDTEGGELPERCARKNHHGKTYERCRQITSRPDQGPHREARDPGRGVPGWGRTKAMGTLIRTNHEKDAEMIPACKGGPAESNAHTETPRTPAHRGDSARTHPDAHRGTSQHTRLHAPPAHAHTQRAHSHARSRGPSRSGSQSGDSRSCGTKRKSRGGDEERGHLVYDVGFLLKERYEVVSTLGEGAFGKVVECLDRSKNDRVALKIVKNIERFREAAKSEIAVLREINSLDDDQTFACVRMLDWFDHHGHICIVFELLGLSTFDQLRENDFMPFTVEQIRHMAFQIFRASFIEQVTHTDLKPGNILFVRSDYDKRDERTLRSLDVKVTHDSKEHLAMMERVLGPIPPSLLSKTRKRRYVDRERLDWDENSSSGRYVRKHCKPLKQYMQSKSVEHQQLFDLIGSMLEYDVHADGLRAKLGAPLAAWLKLPRW
ncbi:hypothetical protein CRUP_032073 [Coryphaenoides rupestris]|nr:hypothetical protein CRUP_032073 [Coryphaenoides rupestris]